MSAYKLATVAIVAFCSLINPVRADEPILLRYKLGKDDRLTYKTTHESKQVQTIATQKTETTTTQEALMSRVVDQIDANGMATLKTKAERRKVKVNEFEFDSKSTERDTTSAVGAAITPILERLTGSEYQVIVTPRGEVTDVKGYVEMIADLIKDNPLGAQLSGAGGGAGGARLAEQDSFLIFSEQPVKPGDQWENPFDVELPGLGRVKGKLVCVYEGNDEVAKRKTARIGITADISVELNLEAGGAKITGTIATSSSSGTVQFDPQAGRIVSSKRTTAMAGQLTVDAGGMIIPVDTQQEETSTAELLEKLPE
jgi:Family of unknown function (DUF6263)